LLDSANTSDEKASDESDDKELKSLQDSVDKLNTSWAKHKESKSKIEKASKSFA